MDYRLFVVAAPIALALAWAVFNAGRAALGQFQTMLKQYKDNQMV
ncbi:MAG: photosystem II protein Y [Cyanobium sp. NAT70]|mgnify:CR=1 FL=1|nr:photosystem II protein Y [Cyanobium sp. NAT70]|tara:strand:+ start:2042 stop:2176 length:135 start_codon:yes stop_codon:yes gene_type:complete